MAVIHFPAKFSASILRNLQIADISRISMFAVSAIFDFNGMWISHIAARR